jgi:hypothetical protein
LREGLALCGAEVGLLHEQQALIFNAVRQSVEDAVGRGQPIDVTDLAIDLCSRFPQSGVVIDDICAEINCVLAELKTAPIARAS